MKKVIRRNQVIVTSLALLIAVAGYLNFTDVKLGNKEQQVNADSDSILKELDTIDYDLTDQSALLAENGTFYEGTEETASLLGETGTPGEAILTEAAGFAAQAKLGREQIRSQNKADLQAILDNEQLSEDQKQEAVSVMVSMTENAEREAAAELLLEAKGFSNAIVNLTGETADVVVPDVELDDTMRAQIEDIVKRKAGVEPSSIVITSLSQYEQEAAVSETSGYDSFENSISEEADPEYGDTSYESEDAETWSEDWVADYDDTVE